MKPVPVDKMFERNMREGLYGKRKANGSLSDLRRGAKLLKSVIGDARIVDAIVASTKEENSFD